MIVKAAPQKQTTTNGKSIAEFIATIPQLDERSVDKDVTVKVFGKRAESLPMLPIGQGIVVIGNINIDSVDNPAGYKDKVVTVMANEILLGSLSPVEASEDGQTNSVAVAPASNSMGKVKNAPKELLTAISEAVDLARLEQIKANADKKGISYDSYKAQFETKQQALTDFSDIPF